MIAIGRLDEAIDEIITNHNEEEKEKVIWELWLHKEFEDNPSYPEFRSRFDTASKPVISKENFEAEQKEAIKKSFEMLENFKPE